MCKYTICARKTVNGAQCCTSRTRGTAAPRPKCWERQRLNTSGFGFVFVFLNVLSVLAKENGVNEKVLEGGSGLPADLRMSGQADSCHGGALNGDWIYQGVTADGKRYYEKLDESTLYGVVYLFYDKDTDGGHEPLVCTENHHWNIYKTKPSTILEQDLDGDKHCLVYAFKQDTSAALHPPNTSDWWVSCGGAQNIPMKLTFKPICHYTNWEYTYPDEWVTVNQGCGDGIGRQRTEVESCRARGGCLCKNKRIPRIEHEMQCYMAFGSKQLEAD